MKRREELAPGYGGQAFEGAEAAARRVHLRRSSKSLHPTWDLHSSFVGETDHHASVLPLCPANIIEMSVEETLTAIQGDNHHPGRAMRQQQSVPPLLSCPPLEDAPT